jgi:hypothetical protein
MKPLDADLKQAIIEHFEYYEVDDMHSHAGAQRFLTEYKQVVDLQDLLEFLNEDLSQFLTIPEQLLTLMNLHLNVEVELGQALHATQFRLLQPELELACSPSVGIRVITALASKSTKILELTAVDPCYLVRLASYENKNLPKEDAEYLRKDDTYFREFTTDDIERMGDDYDELATVEACGCSVDGISDFIHDKYSESLLEIPPIAHEFEKRMRYFGEYDFGTQPLPGPMEDYMFLGIIDYLKGPIPDQYVVNHAGHGVNSYSLNFRYALGELAVLMQVGYGGAYGDVKEDAKRWDECVDHIGNVMLLNPEDRKEGLWQRKYLLLYSDFRFENHIQLLVYRNEKWTELPLVATWDDVYEFFAFWGPEKESSS